MANPSEYSTLQRWGEVSAVVSARINRVVELLCAALLAILIVDIWIGVLGRYVLELPVTWTEELPQYVMIWAALLAISCGVARREHVAVTALLRRLPLKIRCWIDVVIDARAFLFFPFLCYFGIGMTQQGASQYATILNDHADSVCVGSGVLGAGLCPAFTDGCARL